VALQLAPRNPAVRHLMRLLCLIKGQYQTAIDDATKAIEESNTPQEKALAYCERGFACAWERIAEKQAREDYEAAIQLNPKCGDAYIGRGGTYHYFKNQEDFDKILNDYTMGIALSPYDIAGYWGHEKIYSLRNKQNETVTQDSKKCRAFIRQEIDSPMIYVVLDGTPYSIIMDAETETAIQGK
jgi:tetratricopeptide (TPR) repeat protein